MQENLEGPELAPVAEGGAAVDRRELLKHGFVWGSLGSLAMAAPALADAGPSQRRRRRRRGARPVLDVACLGNTLRIILAPGTDPASGDLHSSTFLVEGKIYREGTIPRGETFDPDSEPAIGRWLCRGWFIALPDRARPDVLTTQEYVLHADITRRVRNQLVSSGFEGSAVEPFHRSVIGGAGTYSGARGTVDQDVTGTNTTRFNPPGLGDLGPAPNFEFSFRLKG